MNAKILFGLLCLVTVSANAAIPYRVEQIASPADMSADNGSDSASYARDHRFYIGGAYNFSMWDKFTDDKNVHLGGKNTDGFDVMAGLRLYDTFRLEANYSRFSPKWNKLKMTADAAMINAIFDARIDSIYRLFRTQTIVPYVGAGAGAAWLSADDDVKLGNEVVPVFNVMAGFAIEMGDNFAVDLGYRYLYMMTPDVAGVSDLAPTAHQFRAGARVNF